MTGKMERNPRPGRAVAAIASLGLIICAGCADFERSLSHLTGTRPAPYAMKGLTEQELLRDWGGPQSSYVDTQGDRHLSYTYEGGTSYGSTPPRAQPISAGPVLYGGTYREKTDTSTRTQSSGSIIRDEHTLPVEGGTRTVISQSSSGTSSSHTKSTTTGSGVRWSVADPAAYSQASPRGAMCTTTFMVRDGIVHDYKTTGGPSC